jgi:hypothetical protein
MLDRVHALQKVQGVEVKLAYFLSYKLFLNGIRLALVSVPVTSSDGCSVRNSSLLM